MTTSCDEKIIFMVYEQVLDFPDVNATLFEISCRGSIVPTI